MGIQLYQFIKKWLNNTFKIGTYQYVWDFADVTIGKKQTG